MDKIQTIKERILIFLEIKGIKRASFYKETGISASTFKGVGLKSDLGVDKLVKILIAYPELNNHLIWLLKGEGNINELISSNIDNFDAKKGISNKDIPNADSEEKILNLLASIFAKSNLYDKGLMFMQKKITKIEENQNKILKVLSEKNSEDSSI